MILQVCFGNCSKRKEKDWFVQLTSTMNGCTSSKYSEHLSVSDSSTLLSISSSWSGLQNTTGKVRLQVFNNCHMQKHIPQCASWEGISVKESRDSNNCEHLSMRLLILQSFLGWWCVAPTFIPLRNAIKSVAYAQTSVPFRNAIKRSCLQKVVYTYVSLLFLAL